jgi:hypothetical protein
MQPIRPASIELLVDILEELLDLLFRPDILQLIIRYDIETFPETVAGKQIERHTRRNESS